MANSEKQTQGVIFDLNDTLLIGSVTDTGARFDYLRPGTHDALVWLTEKGIKKGVVTTFREVGALALLHQAGIAEFFDSQHVIGSDSVRKQIVTQDVPQKLPGIKGLLGKTQSVPVQKQVDTWIRFKPDPEPVRYLLHEWNMHPDNVKFVGDDTYADLMCAASADVEFVQITPISIDPDRDLLGFLKPHIQ